MRFSSLRALLACCFLALIVSCTADENIEYEVGVATGFIVDSSRPWDPVAAAIGTPALLGFTDAEFDAATNMHKAVRTLMVEIWYPIEPDDLHEGDQRATWGDFVFGSWNARLYSWLPPEAQQLVFDLERGSFFDKPVADRGSPFPLIIYLHGNGGGRHEASATAEALARTGYVVIAPTRTGNSTFDRVGLIPGGVHADVRDPEEYKGGHVEGAQNLPLDQVRDSLNELPEDREILTYCYVGQRSYYAARALIQYGFKVRNISGGFKTFTLR